MRHEKEFSDERLNAFFDNELGAHEREEILAAAAADPDLARRHELLTFVSCGNAIARYRNAGLDVTLVPEARVERMAIEHIVDRVRLGWTYLKIRAAGRSICTGSAAKPMPEKAAARHIATNAMSTLALCFQGLAGPFSFSLRMFPPPRVSRDALRLRYTAPPGDRNELFDT
ncbi:MAG: hypothetical protein FJY34_04920 [Betaproteobacteria bacterium]|nr:hypothetical protein [Betaproteobacteria bacterium]